MGFPAGPGIDKPHRFHGAETEGVAAAICELFDRHASFEVHQLFEIPGGDLLRFKERFHERSILFRVQRAVEIIVPFTFTVARGPKYPVVVN